MSLGHTTVLTAWDKIQELRQRIKSCINVIQGLREKVSDFLRRLTNDVQIRVADPEARWVLIDYLVLKNDNLQCKKILVSLKLKSVPKYKWILHIGKVESLDFNIEAYVEGVISKIMKKCQIPNALTVVEQAIWEGIVDITYL